MNYCCVFNVEIKSINVNKLGVRYNKIFFIYTYTTYIVDVKCI